MVFLLTRRFPLERGRLSVNWVYNVTFCIALALAHRAVYLFIGWVLHVADYRRLASLYQVYNKNFFFNLPNGLMCYATVMLVGYAVAYYNHHQEEEVKISRLETVVVQTQLQMKQA